MTEKHSPLPWHRSEYNTIVDKDNYELATCYIGSSEEDIANAEFIVKACNMHTELVEALRVIKVDAHDTLKVMSDSSPAAKLALQHIEKIATNIINKATKEG